MLKKLINLRNMRVYPTAAFTLIKGQGCIKKFRDKKVKSEKNFYL